MALIDDLGLKDDLKDILVSALNKALARYLPMIVGLGFAALVFAFLAGRFSKRR